MNKVLVINPTELDSVKIINELDENVINNKGVVQSTLVSSKEVKTMQKKANEVERTLVFKDAGFCHISGENDIKKCTIVFITNDNKTLSKQNIIYAINYAFDTLSMETVFVEMNTIDKKLERILLSLDFINLGEVDNKTVYLKEKEEKEIALINSNIR